MPGQRVGPRFSLKVDFLKVSFDSMRTMAEEPFVEFLRTLQLSKTLSCLLLMR